jgi:hypothetical protein
MHNPIRSVPPTPTGLDSDLTSRLSGNQVDTTKGRYDPNSSQSRSTFSHTTSNNPSTSSGPTISRSQNLFQETNFVIQSLSNGNTSLGEILQGLLTNTRTDQKKASEILGILSKELLTNILEKTNKTNSGRTLSLARESTDTHFIIEPSRHNSMWDSLDIKISDNTITINLEKINRRANSGIEIQINPADYTPQGLINKLQEIVSLMHDSTLFKVKKDKSTPDKEDNNPNNNLGQALHNTHITKLTNLNLVGVSVTSADFTNSKITNCSFERCFISANFNNSVIENCQTSHTELHILSAQGMNFAGNSRIDATSKILGTLRGASITCARFVPDIKLVLDLHNVNWDTGNTKRAMARYDAKVKLISGDTIERGLLCDPKLLRSSLSNNTDTKIFGRLFKPAYDPNYSRDQSINLSHQRKDELIDYLSKIGATKLLPMDPLSSLHGRVLNELQKHGDKAVYEKNLRSRIDLDSNNSIVIDFNRSAHSERYSEAKILHYIKDKQGAWELFGYTDNISPEVAELTIAFYLSQSKHNYQAEPTSDIDLSLDDDLDIAPDEPTDKAPLEGEIEEEKGLKKTRPSQDDIIDAEFEVKRDPELIKEAQKARISQDVEEEPSNKTNVILIPPTGPEQIDGGFEVSKDTNQDEEVDINPESEDLNIDSETEDVGSQQTIDSDTKTESQEPETQTAQSEQGTTEQTNQPEPAVSDSEPIGEQSLQRESNEAEQTPKESLSAKIKNKWNDLKSWVNSFRRNKSSTEASDDNSTNNENKKDLLTNIGDGIIYTAKLVWEIGKYCYNGAVGIHNVIYKNLNTKSEANLTDTPLESTNQIENTIENAKAFIVDNIAKYYTRAEKALIKFTKDLDLDALKDRGIKAKNNILNFTDELLDRVRERHSGLTIDLPSESEKRAEFKKQNSILLKSALPDYVHEKLDQMYNYGQFIEKIKELDPQVTTRADGVIGIRNGNNLLRFEETQSGKIRVHIKLEGGDWQKLGSMYLVEGDNGKLSDPERLASRFMKADFNKLDDIKELLGIKKEYKTTDKYIVPAPLHL